MQRREFLSAAFAVGVTAARPGFAAPAQTVKDIQDYGAKPNGQSLSTAAIQRAIDDAFHSGGGTVRVPPGTFLTGRIDLKSRVTLYLETGSTLLGSKSLDDYDGSNGDTHHRHLIFATDADNVTIAGPGRIDGQGPTFWEPSGRAPLPPEEQWRAVASHSFKAKKSGTPSPMLYFVNCRKLHIEDVRIENAPGWTVNAVNCDDLTIGGIAIKNPVFGPNTDGVDLTGCQNVLVSNCSVETGDDAICLKSEGVFGQEPRLIQNVVVTNCTLTTCCNGFKLGTNSEGGFENISFTNSVVTNQDVPFPDRVISGIALEVVDGGWIDGVHASGIRMERTRTAIFIRLGNRKPPLDPARHGLRNVTIQDVQASDMLIPSSITGVPGTYVERISLSNVTIGNVLPSRPDWVGRSVPEKDTAYPEAWVFGMLPASGLYVRHARNLRFDHLALRAAQGEARPTVIFDDVNGASLSALTSTPIHGSMPVVQLIQCQDVQIADSTAPSAAAFVGVEGSGSSAIVLANDDLRAATRSAVTAGDVPSGAVTVSGNGSAS